MMQLTPNAKELFEAFSRINAQAFRKDRLLSCPNLSKAPNYGDVLCRYLDNSPHPCFSLFFLLCALGRYSAANLLHLGFLLLARLFICLLSWHLPLPLRSKTEGHSLRLLDSFALLPAIARDGAHKEGYLPGLETAGPCLRLLRLYGSRHPLILWRALRALAKDPTAFTEVHLLVFTDWLALVWHILAYPFALAALIKKLRPAPPHSPEAYIRTALIRTLGQCIVPGEARRLAGFRLGLLLAACPWPSEPLAQPSIISWYENQTINKAFQRGLAQAETRTNKHVHVTGAQLFLWPPSLLNNHLDHAEQALGLDPDVIVVNGPHFLPSPPDPRYTTGPSLRYRPLFAIPCQPPSPDKPLLVLLSYHPAETRTILVFALALAQTGQPLAYKFHPATKPQDYTALLPPNPVLVKGDLYAALHKASAVLGSGSGSLVEAVAFGLPALAVQDPSLPAEARLNYLPEHGHYCGQNTLWASVSSPEDVAPALEALRQYAGQDRTEDIQAFRNALFSPPEAEAVFQLLHGFRK